MYGKGNSIKYSCLPFLQLGWCISDFAEQEERFQEPVHSSPPTLLISTSHLTANVAYEVEKFEFQENEVPQCSQ